MTSIIGKIKDYFKENKRLCIILLVVFTVLIILLILLIVFLKRPKNEEVMFTATGSAVSVMTERLTTYNAIWEPKRYSDELYLPQGITILEGNLVIADSLCDRIQILDGKTNIRIGKPGQYGHSLHESGALVDGYRENALFAKPSDVAIDSNGNIIVSDSDNHVIRKIDKEFVITIAGNGESGYINGKESEAAFNTPRSVAVDKQGNIYVSDTLNHCIRKIDADYNVTLFAGTPTKSGYKDGIDTEALFFEPYGLYCADDGAVYVADSSNHCIRKIHNNVVTTVVGSPGEIDTVSNYPIGGYIDGEIAQARFNFPKDITFLKNGDMIIIDTMNHSVRMMSATEVITLAGGGEPDQYYSSLENVKFTRPEGVALDDENLYISDTSNNRIVALPLSSRLLEGRPSRQKMLEDTRITTNSRYAYRGDIRVYLDGEVVDMGRVAPWNSAEHIYLPIRPLFEALGAAVDVYENQGVINITIGDKTTALSLNNDYFILKGVAVTTLDEIKRLFPYTIEWYSEFSLIAIHTPNDLKNPQE